MRLDFVALSMWARPKRRVHPTHKYLGGCICWGPRREKRFGLRLAPGATISPKYNVHVYVNARCSLHRRLSLRCAHKHKTTSNLFADASSSPSHSLSRLLLITSPEIFKSVYIPFSFLYYFFSFCTIHDLPHRSLLEIILERFPLTFCSEDNLYIIFVNFANILLQIITYM